MNFSERVRRCREHTDVLGRNGWAHKIGEPLAGDPLSWYPDSMASVHRLFDGLTTRLLWFHSYETVVKGLDETRRRDDLRIGDICYSYPVMLNVATSELTIWDGEDLMYADEYDEDDDEEDDIEPVYRTLDPSKFFGEYVFGSKYPELIDRIIGFDGSGDRETLDEWRDLIGQIA
jgi:hypothetical protein